MSDPAAVLIAALRAPTVDDHDHILKLANAVLRTSKSNANAQHARVVALLKLDRFDDALRAIAEGGDALDDRCHLEKTYALYKSGSLKEARAESLKASDNLPAFRHLAAQIAYRAEHFGDAAAAYRQLVDHHPNGEENDVNINLLAAIAQLQWAGLADIPTSTDRQHLDVFETAYNAACAHAARDEFAHASILLKRARDLCETSEDLSPDDKKAELLPIIVQHVYVLSRLGKHAEAAALQKLVVVSDIPEAPTRIVAQNNQVALAADDANPYLTQRIAEAAGSLAGNDKLFAYQQSVIDRNKHALSLQMQKFNGQKYATKAQILSNSSSAAALLDNAHLGVVSAAARTQLETGQIAIDKILPTLEKRPHDIGLLLTVIQFYIQMRRPGLALVLLKTSLKRLETSAFADHADARFAPGLVALAVVLYRLQGRQNSIRTELAKASAYWRSKSAPSSIVLLKEAGIELLRSSNPEHVASAGATFEKLVDESPIDLTAAAGLVASFATSDYAKVEAYLDKLTPVERLTKGINVQSLVDAGVCSIVPPEPTLKKRPATDEPEREKATKRRRKKRLPKDYEEGKQPDPERWLPLRDRSTYRPKGKKGKKRAQEVTQGGVVKEEEMLELVGGAGAVKVEKATGSQGNKKKKKGKK
ncbi:hypothetical protein F5Y16DRAFT_389657 [Xylariaceae sp. FL0255]|nr:hypothetical protein F5Y16DRAFT_389657 [Xylariaceae sp. FL0255]